MRGGVVGGEKAELSDRESYPRDPCLISKRNH